MKIKWNWGTGITLFIILFVSFILFRVYLTLQNPVDLVEKDYYPKGLAFQDRIDEVNNANSVKDKFVIEQTERGVIVHLPTMHPDTGSLHVFRPSDEDMDILLQLHPDSTMAIRFDTKQFHRGKYIMKLYWEELGNRYYLEKNFFFQ